MSGVASSVPGCDGPRASHRGILFCAAFRRVASTVLQRSRELPRPLLVCAASRGVETDDLQRRRAEQGGLIRSRRSVMFRGVGDQASLYRIAAQQHGAFNIAQARAAGFDRSAVHHRISNGTWTRLDDSVYAVLSAPRTWRQTMWAAVLSRPLALLTHWSAGRLLDLSDVPNHEPVILTPRASNTRSSLARVYESDQSIALQPPRSRDCRSRPCARRSWCSPATSKPTC